MTREERLSIIVDTAEKWFLTLSNEETSDLIVKYSDVFAKFQSTTTKLICELYSLEGLMELQRKEINRQINIENKFKYVFKYFFQGDEYDVPPFGILTDIVKFHIIDFKFKHTESSVDIEIWLGHPGLLIGKGGSTIDSLTKYLNDNLSVEVKLSLKEKSIWDNEDFI